MKVWFESNPNGWIVALLLMISFYGGVVRLLEARTGLEVAKLQLEGDIESSPAVFGNRAVLGTRANRIYGIDIR